MGSGTTTAKCRGTACDHRSRGAPHQWGLDVLLALGIDPVGGRFAGSGAWRRRRCLRGTADLVLRPVERGTRWQFGGATPHNGPMNDNRTLYRDGRRAAAWGLALTLGLGLVKA